MSEIIEIDGKKYREVKEIDTISNAVVAVDAMEYVIARTESAGVFAGYLKYRDKQEGRLINARRIWYWDGAASLSELAMKGTSKPDTCKFPCAVDSIDLTNIIEIIPCTEKAKASIEGVAEWTAH